jgi:hypothetical protein
MGLRSLLVYDSEGRRDELTQRGCPPLLASASSGDAGMRPAAAQEHDRQELTEPMAAETSFLELVV